MAPRAPIVLALASLALVASALLAAWGSPADATQESTLAHSSGLPFVVEKEGTGTTPTLVGVRVPGDGGATLLQARVVRTGLSPAVELSIAGPHSVRYEVAGSLLVAGDLANPTFKVHTMQGATETFSARVTNTGATPNLDVWVNGTPEPARYHLETPLRIRYDGDEVRALHVIDPTKPGGAPYLRIERAGGDYSVATPAFSHTIQGDHVSVSEPSPGRTQIELRDGDRQVVEVVTIDRTRDPALVTFQEAKERIAAPVALQGDLAHPTRVAVYTPRGLTLLAYQVADGKASLDLAGQRVLDDATLVRIEGDPLAQPFTLVLRNANGTEERVFVDRDLVVDATGTHDVVDAIVHTAPVSSLHGAPPTMLQAIATDAGIALAGAHLDGTRHLALQGTHRAYLATPEEMPYDRILARLRVDSGAGQVAFAPANDAGDARVWRADYQPSAIGKPAEDALVRLQVEYETRLSPLVVQRHSDGATYAYKLDGGAPTASLDAPTESASYQVSLAWSGGDGGGSGIAGYETQWRRANETAWNPWIALTNETTGVFSGEWDTTYAFRVRSHDAAGNPSAWAEASTRVLPASRGQDDVNDAPDVRILAPAAGDRLMGLVEVRWSASDPDGTPVTTNVQVSHDDGGTWRTLHSGTGTSTVWDTRTVPDGSAYRLRVTATDGALSGIDATGAFSVANFALDAASPGASGGASGAGPAGEAQSPPETSGDAVATEGADAAPGDEDTPFAGPLAVLAGLGAAAYLRRRSR